jgi:hypothetical protein
MFAERCHDKACNAGCKTCRQARLMVRDAIVTSVKEAIANLESHDAARARAHIAGLIELLDQAPPSTVELVGPEQFAALSRDLKQGLSEIGEEALTLARLRGVLWAWVDDPSNLVQ